jgi:hypothetical protein
VRQARLASAMISPEGADRSGERVISKRPLSRERGLRHVDLEAHGVERDCEGSGNCLDTFPVHSSWSQSSAEMSLGYCRSSISSLFFSYGAVAPAKGQGIQIADSGGSRPRIRDDVAHHSDLISLGVPR